LRAVHVSASELHEEFSDFRLENDDDRYETDVKYGFHDVGHQPHVEGGYNDSDHVQRYDGDKYAHRRSAPDPTENEEDQQCKQKYVQNVRKGQLKKAEDRQCHIPLLYPRKDSDNK
jgi:hypothetical protein